MNKTYLNCLFFVILSIFLLFSPVCSQPDTPERIDVGVLRCCPPQYITDENGKPAGFAIDLMDSVGNAAGLQLNYKVYDNWPQLIEAARSGEVKVVPNVDIPGEGKDVFDFSSPYEKFAIRIFISAKTSDIDSLDDLIEKKVAVVSTSKARFFMEKKDDVDLVIYPTMQEALVALLSGQADAFISPEAPVVQLLRNSNIEDHIKAIGLPVLEVSRGLGVIKDHRELLLKLDAALADFVSKPLYGFIYTKWYGKPKPFWNAQRVMLCMTILFIVAVFLLLFCRYMFIRRLNNMLQNASDECVRVHGELERTHIELEERVAQRTRELEKIRNSMEKSQEVAKFGNWDWDIIAHTIWWSDGIYRILGVKPNEFQPTYDEFLKRVHPEDLDFVKDSVKKALAGKDSYSLEHRIVLEDRSVRTIHEEAEIVRDEAGKALRMVGIIQDISEKKSTEATLKFNEERLKTLFQLSQMDDASKNTLANYAMESAVKMTGSKAGYLHFYDEDSQTIIIHLWSIDVLKICKTKKQHQYQVESAGIWADCIRQRRAVIHNNECNTPSQEGYPAGHFPIGRHMVVPVIVDDRIVVIAGVGNKETPYDESDMQQLTLLMNEAWGIIHKKEIKAEKTELANLLRQSQKMEAIGTLAGGIAHDFNNILTPILGYADMVRDEMPLYSPQAENLNHVIRAAKRAKELVQQILAFSRQTEEDRKPVQIQLVVKEALKLLRASIPSTIQIHKQLDPNCGLVLADASQIHQIVMNLCTNAYHAMLKTDGILTVTLGNINIPANDPRVLDMQLSPGNYVQFSVSDTGIGMDRTTIDKIFDPYFTTKKKGEGTGLGLSVVHGIVKSMGGRIITQSEVGKGTTFNIYLPRVTHAAIYDKKAQKPIPRGSEKIMVVDDEETIALMEKQMLESLGYSVAVMQNSMDALREFSDHPEKYDMVITDMAMPIMNGDELALRIMALRPELPIILCTGFSEIIDEPRAKSIGIREFIMKPIIKRNLGEIVRSALDYGQSRSPDS
ncbi:MAG: transporter substrate-binding domain-containing protein [Proteobacteria bacterium]|nr:transporter substrate-binding domain-containing protein [Pseudomonadota bacterium]